MKKINNNPRTLTYKILQILFLRVSSSPAPLQLALLVIETVLFTFLICSNAMDLSQFSQFVSVSLAFVLLMVCICFRACFSISLTRVVYILGILPLYGLSDKPEIIIILSLFIALVLIFDITSHLQYEFITNNCFSETLNYTKILHYLVILFSILLKMYPRCLVGQNLSWVNQLLCLLAFLLLTVCKFASIPAKPNYHQIILRFYSLCSIYYLKNLLENWLIVFKQSYMHVIVIVISQGLYFIISKKLNNFQLQNEMANGNLTNSIFHVLAYHYGTSYSDNMQIAQSIMYENRPVLKAIIHNETKNNNKMQKNTKIHKLTSVSGHASKYKINGTTKIIKQKQEQSQNKLNTLKKEPLHEITRGSVLGKQIAIRALQLLAQNTSPESCQGFNQLFMIAQIRYGLFNNLVEAKKIIHELKQLQPIYSIFRRIYLYRLQQKIVAKIQSNCRQQSTYFNDFFQNENLRTHLIRHSQQYLSLWKYINNPDVLFSRLRKFVHRILKRKQIIEQIFQKLAVKCSTIIYMYSQYLYKVRRECQKARKVWDKFVMFQQKQIQMHCQNKIYVYFTLQSDKLLYFNNVGFNIKKLLGYSRSLIRNSNISLMIPSFFIKTHERIIQSVLSNSNSILSTFQKQIMVKHADGYYLPAIFDLKLVYDSEGKLGFEGFIQIIQNQTYDWKNYFFVKQGDKQLMEVGPALQDLVELHTDKFNNVNHFFDLKHEKASLCSLSQCNYLKKDSISQKVYYCLQNHYNGQLYNYEQTRSLCSDSAIYTHYARKNQIQVESLKFEQQGQNIRNSMRNQQSFEKYQTKYEDFQTNLQQYFQMKKEVLKKINSKKVGAVLLVIIVLFMLSFAMEGYLMGRVNINFQSNSQIMTDLNDLNEFYHNLQNLGLNIKKLLLWMKLGKIYKYQQYDLVTLTLNLQQKNELMSKFDKKIYGKVKDEVVHQPKSLNVLISDLISNIYFSFFFMNDRQLAQISRYNAHTEFDQIWGSTLDDYLRVCLQSASNTSDVDHRIKIAIQIVVGIIVTIIYILVLFQEGVARQREYQALQAIYQVNATHMFCSSIKQFICIIGNIEENDVQDGDNTKIFNYKKQASQSFNASKAELISAISRGDLTQRDNDSKIQFEQQLMQKSSKIVNIRSRMNTLPQNTIQIKQRREQDQNANKTSRISPRPRLFLLIWTLSFIASNGILFANVITDHIRNKVSIQKSLPNLLNLLNRQLIFSSVVICYMDSIGYGNQPEMFKLNYNKFVTMNSQNAVFDEIYLAQFANFTQWLKNVRFSYMPQYMPVNLTYPQFINQFQLTYSSSIQRFAAFMASNLNTSNWTAQYREYHIQLLFDCHYLIQQTFYQLLKAYLKDYNQFQQNKLKQLSLYYWLQFGIFGLYLALAATAWGLTVVAKHRWAVNALDLLHSNSFQDESPFQDHL